jgi:hypothetical protein
VALRDSLDGSLSDEGFLLQVGKEGVKSGSEF